MVQIAEPARQKRPGGRTAEVTRRINDAIIELLIDGGLDACTFQRVAERAGIERSTLYRRCPDRWPTIVDAIIEYGQRQIPIADTGSFRGDLKGTLMRVREALHSPIGQPVMAVAVALLQGAAPGETERFWASRRDQLAPMFLKAIDRGELPPDVNAEELFAIASGSLFFFAFVIGRPARDELIDTAVDMVCDRYCLK
jgi:AcrR family transcriptional regulator